MPSVFHSDTSLHLILTLPSFQCDSFFCLWDHSLSTGVLSALIQWVLFISTLLWAVHHFSILKALFPGFHSWETRTPSLTSLLSSSVAHSTLTGPIHLSLILIFWISPQLRAWVLFCTSCPFPGQSHEYLWCNFIVMLMISDFIS